MVGVEALFYVLSVIGIIWLVDVVFGELVGRIITRVFKPKQCVCKNLRFKEFEDKVVENYAKI